MMCVYIYIYIYTHIGSLMQTDSEVSRPVVSCLQAKYTKETKETKETKDAKETKETKDTKYTKDTWVRRLGTFFERAVQTLPATDLWLMLPVPRNHYRRNWIQTLEL